MLTNHSVTKDGNSMSKLTHLNTNGEAHMVDVSGKADTARTAIAQSQVELTPAIVSVITDSSLPKGDLYATARIAGIQAAKKTSDLIPLCHPLPLSKVTLDIDLQGNSLIITAVCKTTGKTGVEMEALTAASVAALTVYDMCKGLDKGMVISQTKLLEKSGGKSGNWCAETCEES